MESDTTFTPNMIENDTIIEELFDVNPSEALRPIPMNSSFELPIISIEQTINQNTTTKKRKRKQENPKKITFLKTKNEKSSHKKLRHNFPVWETLANAIIDFVKENPHKSKKTNKNSLSATLKDSVLLGTIFENSTDDQKKQIQSKFIFENGDTIFHRGKGFRTLEKFMQLINNIKIIVDINAKNNSGETAVIKHLKEYRGGACSALLCAGAKSANFIITLQSIHDVLLLKYTEKGGAYRPYYNIVRSLKMNLDRMPKKTRQSFLKELTDLETVNKGKPTGEGLTITIMRSLSKNS